MTATTLCVASHLPKVLSAIVIDYFGRSTKPWEMAELGQWEDCLASSPIHENAMFSCACASGHIAIVELMIARGASSWNSGLAYACSGGHLDIAELMIAHGASDWVWGLTYACRAGELNAVELMIAHGADDWDWGLAYACQGGQYAIVELMIARGAIYCHNCSKPADDHITTSPAVKFERAAS